MSFNKKKRLLKKAGIVFFAVLGINIVVNAIMNVFSKTQGPLITIRSVVIIFLVVIFLIWIDVIEAKKRK